MLPGRSNQDLGVQDLSCLIKGPCTRSSTSSTCNVRFTRGLSLPETASPSHLRSAGTALPGRLAIVMSAAVIEDAREHCLKHLQLRIRVKLSIIHPKVINIAEQNRSCFVLRPTGPSCLKVLTTSVLARKLGGVNVWITRSKTDIRPGTADQRLPAKAAMHPGASTLSGSNLALLAKRKRDEALKALSADFRAHSRSS